MSGEAVLIAMLVFAAWYRGRVQGYNRAWAACRLVIAHLQAQAEVEEQDPLSAKHVAAQRAAASEGRQ